MRCKTWAFFRQGGGCQPMQMHFLWKNAICFALLFVRVIAQCPCAEQRDCTSCVIGQSPQNFPLQTMFQPKNTVERAPEHERYSTVTFKRNESCYTTCSWNRRLKTCSDTDFQGPFSRNGDFVPWFSPDLYSGGRYDLYARFATATLCQDINGKFLLALRPTFAND